MIVYGKPESDHSGLVVEVDAVGKPSKIISKWGATGGVLGHPPAAGPYGSDWEIYRRKTDRFDDDAKKALDKLREAYEAAVKEGDARKAHLKAFALCRTKNALKRV